MKSLTNLELLSNIRALAQEERRIGVELLHHIREIDARKLYGEKHSSLHEFLVQELKYSDGAAHRRIQAMRLLRDLPETEAKLSSGEITLSTASQLQNFFRAEKKLGTTYASAAKRELLSKIEGKSTRQTEGLLAAISLQAVPRERERTLNESESSITFVAGSELREKLMRLRGLVAHKNPCPSYAELFEMLADIALQKLDPSKSEPLTAGKQLAQPTEPTLAYAKRAPHLLRAPSPQSTHGTCKFQPIQPSRYIPTALKRLTWSRAQGRCEFLDSNGRRCTSSYALEIDHKIPVGRGGIASEANLQLLCRSHNAHKNLGDYGFVWRRPGDLRVAREGTGKI